MRSDARRLRWWLSRLRNAVADDDREVVVRALAVLDGIAEHLIRGEGLDADV